MDTVYRKKASELAILVGHIREYTVKLAEDNNMEIDVKETDAPIIDLKEYLAMQKRIFNAA